MVVANYEIRVFFLSTAMFFLNDAFHALRIKHLSYDHSLLLSCRIDFELTPL